MELIHCVDYRRSQVLLTVRGDAIGTQMEEDDEDEDEWAVTMVEGRRDIAGEPNPNPKTNW
jgi:hypothetical protein